MAHELWSEETIPQACSPSATAAPECCVWQPINKNGLWLLWPTSVAYVLLKTPLHHLPRDATNCGWIHFYRWVTLPAWNLSNFSASLLNRHNEKFDLLILQTQHCSCYWFKMLVQCRTNKNKNNFIDDPRWEISSLHWGLHTIRPLSNKDPELSATIGQHSH